LSIWIAVDDQPFTVVGCPEFQELIKICNKDAKVPSADTIRNDILNLFTKQRSDMQCLLQVSIYFLLNDRTYIKRNIKYLFI
jgi:hypothetical protein